MQDELELALGRAGKATIATRLFEFDALDRAQLFGRASGKIEIRHAIFADLHVVANAGKGDCHQLFYNTMHSQFGRCREIVDPFSDGGTHKRDIEHAARLFDDLRRDRAMKRQADPLAIARRCAFGIGNIRVYIDLLSGPKLPVGTGKADGGQRVHMVRYSLDSASRSTRGDNLSINMK